MLRYVTSFSYILVPVQHLLGILWAIPKLTDRRVAVFFCIFLSMLSCSYKVLHALMVIFCFSSIYLNIFNSITINKLCCPGIVLFCSLNPHGIMHTSIRADPPHCFLLRFSPAAKLLYVNFFFIEPLQNLSYCVNFA